MKAPPSVKVTPVPAQRPDASARAALESLAEHGVSVLVDESERPVGILTYSDMSRLRTVVDDSVAKASELFELGREIYTVSERDRPSRIAQQVIRHGLKSGIVAVDDRGRYKGYVFVRDLRELLGALKDERKRAEDQLESLRAQHPVPFQRVERIFKSGSDE